MNNLRNRVQLIGNLGTTPEVIEFKEGRKLVKFTLATNESYKNKKGETIKETQWHNIVAWGNSAKIAEQYLEKGKEVCVEGKLSNRNYEDKDGVKRYVTEIVVQDILMLGKKQ